MFLRILVRMFTLKINFAATAQPQYEPPTVDKIMRPKSNCIYASRGVPKLRLFRTNIPRLI